MVVSMREGRRRAVQVHYPKGEDANHKNPE